MTATALTRRECLSLLGASGALGLAGCSGGEADPDEPEPTATDTDSGGQTPTETDAGTDSVRIGAPAEGLVAEFDAESRGSGTEGADVRAAVAEAMPEVAERDVRVEGEGTIEVRADGDPDALVDGLAAAGYDVSTEDVRRGVTASTRDEIVAVLRNRLATAGYENATVSQAGGDGERAVVVEVPDAERAEVADLLAARGRVEIVASFPAETGDGGTEQREEVLATQGDFARVGPVREGGAQPPSVPVALTEEAATDLSDAMTEYGFTEEGVGNCRWQDDREDPGYCIYTVVDGEVAYAASVSAGLAEVFRNDEFVDDPRFTMMTGDHERAEALRRNLEAGALPAPLAVERGD